MQGPGPFEKLPAGVTGVSLAKSFTAPSGSVYKLNGYPIVPATGLAYVVAQLDVPNAAPSKVPGPNVWIGYWQATTGVKKFVQANATDATQLQKLLTDLGVVR